MISQRLPLVLLAVAVGLIPIIPGVPGFWITLLNYIGVFSIVAIGLVVLTGIGGMTSLGQAMFVGIGAYVTAVLTTSQHIDPWLTLPLSIGVTAVIAWLIGLITLRLSGHYLALATIAWNVSFFFLLGSIDLFGRYDGVTGIPPISILGVPLLDDRKMYYLIYGLVALLIVLTLNLLNSRSGRTIRALRGGAIAAESSGINTSWAKMTAFVYAAALAGLAGWLYAHLLRAVNPSPFNLNASIEYLLMVVVGGAASIWGAVLGAAIVTIMKDQLQNLLPMLVQSGGNFEAIVFGVMLLALLQVAPEGLWPNIARWFKLSDVPAFRRGASGGDQDVSEVRQIGSADGKGNDRASKIGNGKTLRVRELTKSFGGLTAVRGMDFDLSSGEVVGLIGPNGAGKSTIFNLVTGHLPPTSGQITLGDVDLIGLLPRDIAKLGLARTFQHVQLATDMSVLENVALGAHLSGSAGTLRAITKLDGDEERKLFRTAERALDRVHLSEYAGKRAVSLSLGQQRIVEIARALCMSPSMLLLDEPAAGLRHFEKAALRDLLLKLRMEGVAILLVEHDMDFVMNTADRVVVVNFGVKLAEGTPAEVRRNPQVIEAYLGSIE